MKQIVVIGGSFAGRSALDKLTAGIKGQAEVTLVDERDGACFFVATPRALVDPGVTEQLMAPFATFLLKYQGKVKFCRGRVTSIDPAGRVRLADGAGEIPFDYLILATGTTYGGPLKSDSRDLEMQVREIKELAGRIKEAGRVMVVGGGASGVELAGEIATDYPGKQVMLVHRGPALLPGPHKAQAGERALEKLKGKGVHVRLESQVEGLTPEEVTRGYTYATRTMQIVSRGGKESEGLESDLQIYAWAKGVPNTVSLDSLGPEVVVGKGGYIRVRETLQIPGHDHIFAVGDVCDADRNTAVAARSQGALAASNLLALMQSSMTGIPAKLTKYSKIMNIQLITIGRKDGLFILPFMILGGWLTRLFKSRDAMAGSFRKEVGPMVPSS